MIKMHLSARPANEGARRLAWWIVERAQGDVDTAAREFGCDPATVERIVIGEIIPATDLALPIGLVTDNFISRRDWRNPPAAGWFVRPTARQTVAELAAA